jgi:hypothetical protein
MGKRSTTNFNANDTTHTTFTALTNAGTTPLEITRILLSVGAADNLILTITGIGTSNNQLGPIYLPANGGLLNVLGEESIQLAVGGTMNITKGSNVTATTCLGAYIQD